MYKYALLLGIALLLLGVSTQVPTPLTLASIEHTYCTHFELLTDGDDDVAIFHFGSAATVTGLACHGDAATTISMADLTGDDIDDGGSGNQICTTGTGPLTYDKVFTGTTSFTAGEGVEFDTITESTPTWTVVCLLYTLD